MEYLIYHLRPYGVNAKFVSGDFSQHQLDEQLLYLAGLKAARKDQGPDDYKGAIIVDGIDQNLTKGTQ